MPRMKGVWRQEWLNCDRCGFPHPIGMLTLQLGMRLCTCHGCRDDLSNYYRPAIISGILSSDNEGKSDKPDVFTGPQELTF